MLLPKIVAQHADRAGCGQYRVIQPGMALGRAGLAEVLLTDDFVQEAAACDQADAVVVQLLLNDHQIEYFSELRRRRNQLLVHELDDLVTHVPSKSLHAARFTSGVIARIRETMALCDRVVVSTEPLAEHFRWYCDDIRIGPNRIDKTRWVNPAINKPLGKKPRVGWAGAHGHEGDLGLIAPVVSALADEVDWVFLGMCPDELQPYMQEFHHGVSAEQYPAKLARLGLDLALAPLEDNEFNEAKSNLKLLEYGILGYPVVCTDIYPYQCNLPVNRLPNDAQLWIKTIRELLIDRAALATQGQQLKQAVLDDWLLEDGLPSWRAAWLP